jgi:hypothetical protein
MGVKNSGEKVVFGPPDEFVVELGLLFFVEADFLQGLQPNDSEAFGDGEAAADAIA